MSAPATVSPPTQPASAERAASARPDALRAESQAASAFQWTRARYDRAVDAGVFDDVARVELLDGLLVARMSQNRPHRVSTILLAQLLRDVFGADAHVQEEKPVALSDVSEPEPDIAVVLGSPRDYDPHPGPDALLLVVEVSDTTLADDRTRKAALYAAAGVAEYWIVNLRDACLEVHRDPRGDAYAARTVHGPGESVVPLARPDASISVSDLLP